MREVLNRWIVFALATLGATVGACDDDATVAIDAASDVASEADPSPDLGIDMPGEVSDARPDLGGDDATDLGPGADAVSDPTADTAEDAATDPDDGRFEIVFQVTVPSTTPSDAHVYIAGNFQDWNPGDPSYELTRIGARLHEIALRFEVGTALEFKFTRGDWSVVEKGPSGEEIANRRHTVTGAETLALTVASWADLSPLPHTISGDVSQITVPGFLDGRRVWVYLPPGYDDEPDARYPVLYMLDGQNVFDQATSFAGEWEVDESCESLIAAGQMAPIIVVAVDNSSAARIGEYTPWPDPGYGGGDGDDHLDAFVDTLVPYIDATHRTLTGPAHRGLAGSSLGGLMSLYAAYTRAETFGLVAALSPSLWWDEGHLLDFVSVSTKPAVRIYADMGTREMGSLVDADHNGVDDSIDRLRALRAELLDQGFVEDVDLLVVEDDGGTHSESDWAARFPEALRFLFPPPAR